MSPDAYFKAVRLDGASFHDPTFAATERSSSTEVTAAADCATSGVEVVALLAEFESFTSAAWDAVREAARIAVLATLARGLITPEQYETLITPVEAARAVMREEAVR